MNANGNLVQSQWCVVTFSKPTLFPRSNDESWLLNPPRRYVFNSNTLDALRPCIETLSDLKGSSGYVPLHAKRGLAKSRILVERHRDRGIGDLLFTTGVLEYLYDYAGTDVKFDYYALADRGAVLANHRTLHLGGCLAGPLHYDDFGHYNYHWLIDNVTECNEEPDQLNVYDALFQSLGYDYKEIDARYKKPSAYLVDSDYRSLDQLYRHVWQGTSLDLRSTAYYVVAPFSAASIRSMPYSVWLRIILALSQRRPVVVVGSDASYLPDTDMSAGEFIQKVSSIQNAVNAIGATTIRILMAVVKRAKACVTLDSGTLYIAQAVGTPAVSIWGSHDPGVRIGYSPEYMELAVWNQGACRYAPCYAYAAFPKHKCPDGERQVSCDVLASVEPEAVIEKMDIVEARGLQK